MYVEDKLSGFNKLSALIAKANNLTVKHQETCPDCGKTLVNIYKKDDIWKCRLCWEKFWKENK